jgi:hypothetical protein
VSLNADDGMPLDEPVVLAEVVVDDELVLEQAVSVPASTSVTRLTATVRPRHRPTVAPSVMECLMVDFPLLFRCPAGLRPVPPARHSAADSRECPATARGRRVAGA